jgi:4-amino-4-deoxy-L-arabinose transferase-like glycosyltransferase
MQSGCPVIASNASSIPEVVGDAALIVDPHSEAQIADAMLRLATEPECAAELRERGLERARRFTWRRCARSDTCRIRRGGRGRWLAAAAGGRMTVEAVPVPRGARLASLRVAVLPLALAAVLLLAAPLLLARPANLTSDESLYLAEAYNIAHGKGLTYPSGEPITHRAPLFPLVLAPAVALGAPGAAHTVTRAVVVIDALLLMLVAWRMAGALAGAIAGMAAAASSFLNGLGTTLYLDPMRCAFMLLALLALHEATRVAATRWCVAAGLCLAAAFLVKESAVQWAPLGVLAWLALPSLRNATGARGALAFTLAFVAGVAGWWIWFWTETGQLYMLGDERGVSMLAAGAGLSAFALASRCGPACRACLGPRVAALRWRRQRSWSRGARSCCGLA